MESRMDFRKRVVLGRTGLVVSRIGIASSYGIDGDSIVRAYDDHGINYFYWGSVRRKDFGSGIRRLAARHRDDIVIVIQTYSRLASLVAPSLERALRELYLDHTDILLLGAFNSPPSPAVLGAAESLRECGKARFLAVSCHRRATFAEYARHGVFDVLMFRYNAAHRGAETDVLPLFQGERRAGSVSYTATRWGHLLDPSRMPPGEAAVSARDCYRFVLSDSRVDLSLAGPRDAAQLSEALSALEAGPLKEEERARICRIGDHVRAGRKWSFMRWFTGS